MRTYLLTAVFLAGVAGGSMAASSTEMCDDPPCTPAQIKSYQDRVSKHMLRAQQERFVADAKGDTKKAARLDKEFKRTQKRWNDASRALRTAS